MSDQGIQYQVSVAGAEQAAAALGQVAAAAGRAVAPAAAAVAAAAPAVAQVGQQLAATAAAATPAAAAVGAVQQQLAATTAAAPAATSALANVGRSGQQMGQQLARGADEAGNGVKRLTDAASVAGGLILARLVGGLKEAVSAGLAAADAANKAGDRFGLSAEEFQRLSYAAQLSNASMGDVALAVRNLQQAVVLGDAALGKLGLSMTGLRALSPERQFLAAADAIAKVQDPAARSAAAVAAFGRSGDALLPMLQNLRALRHEAEQIGVVLSKAETQAVEKFNDATTRVKLQAQATGGRTVARLTEQTATERTGTGLLVGGGSLLGGLVGGGWGLAAGGALALGVDQQLAEESDREFEAEYWRRLTEMSGPTQHRLDLSGPRIQQARGQRAAARAEEGKRAQAETAYQDEGVWRTQLAKEQEFAAKMGETAVANALAQAMLQGKVAVTKLGGGDTDRGLQVLQHQEAEKLRVQEETARQAKADREAQDHDAAAWAKDYLAQEERHAQLSAQLRERSAKATMSDHKFRLWQMDEEAKHFAGTEEQKTLLLKAQAAERAKLVKTQLAAQAQAVKDELAAFFGPLDKQAEQARAAAAPAAARAKDTVTAGAEALRRQEAAQRDLAREGTTGKGRKSARRRETDAKQAAQRQEREDKRLLARAKAAAELPKRRRTAQGKRAMEWARTRQLRQQAEEGDPKLAEAVTELQNLNRNIMAALGLQ